MGWHFDDSFCHPDTWLFETRQFYSSFIVPTYCCAAITSDACFAIESN